MAVISKMKLLSGGVALLGLFVDMGIAASLTDSEHTETAAPEAIGSMTSDGYLVYSMEVCTIVQNTACAVTLSSSPLVSMATPTYPATTIGIPTDGNPYTSIPTGSTDSETLTTDATVTTTATSVESASTTEFELTSDVVYPTKTHAATASATTGGGPALEVTGAVALGLAGMVVAAFL